MTITRAAALGFYDLLITYEILTENSSRNAVDEFGEEAAQIMSSTA